MAKKMKTPTSAARGISAEELKRVVKEHGRQSALSSEYAGHAGQVIKTAVDKHNLNGKALRAVMANERAEVTKRMDFIRSFIDYSYKMGHFDQADAFDDIFTDIRTIYEEAHARQEEGKSGSTDPVVSAVLN